MPEPAALAALLLALTALLLTLVVLLLACAALSLAAALPVLLSAAAALLGGSCELPCFACCGARVGFSAPDTWPDGSWCGRGCAWLPLKWFATAPGC